MNTRPLNSVESANLAALNSSGINSVLLFVTATGLEKAILDATEPMRRMLLREGIHDFYTQGQGKDSKVIKPAIILGTLCNQQTAVSLYRPQTKKGDPRLWFSEFNKHASPDDVCAVFIFDGSIYLLNLTSSSLASDFLSGVFSYTVQFIHEAKKRNNSVAQELLHLLREIASKGPLKAVCEGDTAIGRSIETALEININSSRSPDFKGIELKSGRSQITGRQTRATLFGCVADWHLSRLRSSTEILNKYGYERGSQFKLYCTVSTRKQNSQGLQLNLDTARNWLCEIFRGNEEQDVCIWELEKLHARLSEKHNETFWIKAKATRPDSDEFFQLESVTHTTNPSHEQFDRLIENGTVTVDHLLKRKPSGAGVDKGPLFKVDRPRLQELFLGLPQTYSLI